MCTHTWNWNPRDQVWRCLLCGRRETRYPSPVPPDLPPAADRGRRVLSLLERRP